MRGHPPYSSATDPRGLLSCVNYSGRCQMWRYSSVVTFPCKVTTQLRCGEKLFFTDLSRIFTLCIFTSCYSWAVIFTSCIVSQPGTTLSGAVAFLWLPCRDIGVKTHLDRCHICDFVARLYRAIKSQHATLQLHSATLSSKQTKPTWPMMIFLLVL